MGKLNRKLPPQSKQIDSINFLDLNFFKLKNGIPVYLLNSGIQDVIKIDVIFEAGDWTCSNPLTANFTSSLLIDGSNRYSSSKIAEKFDFYGTFTNFESGKHFTSIQLYTLSSFFEKSIEILEDIIKRPNFPEKEFDIKLQNELQKFFLDREKTEILAAEVYYPKLFGDYHPYGMVNKANDFEKLDRLQLKEHHQAYYNSANCKIVLAGKLNSNIESILNKYFGQYDWEKSESVLEKTVPPEQNKTGRFIVNKADAVQASIKIGKPIISKYHHDYHGLSILNTILGGYFGSRLMMNLREKNALTYGIYSSLISFLHSGIFSISVNVNTEQSDTAIEKIYDEISILQNELVPEKELQMVKNYLSGEMLRAFDGPLAVSDIYAGLLNYKLDFTYYKRYFETVKNITAKTIRDLANTYLKQDSFTEVLAGKFNH